MSLEPIRELMRHARRNGYAVGYFESWSIESLYGVIDAAERARSPVIIGFNGEFLSHAGRVEAERLGLYGALGRAAAEASKVPCGFVFNECAQDEWTHEAVTAGFNLVMPADPDASHLDYVRRVKAITEHAHAHDVAVEAEIGELPFPSSQGRDHAGSPTSPAEAAALVAETGIDLLAVSVGNVHVALHGSFGLDLDRLAAIHAVTDVPLVLHGGTGIDTEHLRKAITMGVCKVNYGTFIKQHYLAALRKALITDEPNPHVLLGMGGEADLMVVGRRAVREAVLSRIPLLNSAKKG
jgi:ketose-bisphosphate aldolase